jgi:hypothetical protein
MPLASASRVRSADSMAGEVEWVMEGEAVRGFEIAMWGS